MSRHQDRHREQGKETEGMNVKRSLFVEMRETVRGGCHLPAETASGMRSSTEEKKENETCDLRPYGNRTHHEKKSSFGGTKLIVELGTMQTMIGMMWFLDEVITPDL